MSTITLISVTILLGQSDVPPTVGTPPEAAEAKDQEIGLWIHALDADLFADREQATEQLVAAGEKVIPALLQAANEDNLEVATRVVYILQQLALSSEPSTESTAHDALRQLADDSKSLAQRPAKRSLGQLATLFQGRALDELQRLGAEISMSVLDAGGQRIGAVNSVEIGEHWKGSENDLRHLRWLNTLGELKLRGQQVGDEWLAAVSTMKNVGRLRMKHTSISDAGVAHLQQLSPIHLHIWYADLTDACIEGLAAIDGVRVIQLYGTRVTQDGADRLALAKQGVQIDFRPGGALLGVQCHDEVDKCTILGVQRGSAAANAGLQKNDRIVEYDEKPVKNFVELRQMIAKNSPGDRVKVQVNRRGKTIDAVVELGEWQWD